MMSNIFIWFLYSIERKIDKYDVKYIYLVLALVLNVKLTNMMSNIFIWFLHSIECKIDKYDVKYIYLVLA
jgi:hypothetical protein